MTCRSPLIIITGFACLVTFCFRCGTLQAAEAPKTAESLFADADVVVVAEVPNLSIRKQRSTIEKGFGNYDWDITYTLRVDAVEKGDVTQGDEIAVHCFAIRSRRSALESVSLQGHSPVPDRGQTVRAYLRRDGSGFSVLHPNGFAAADNGTIIEAASIENRGFTYLLPLEVWILVVFVGLAAWAVVRMVRFISARRGSKSTAIPTP